jgi:hypothetical protein
VTWFPPNTEINLVERFWTIDPITEQPTLGDPTTVTFRVEDEDGVVTAYVFGVDLNVSNPSIGVFVCTLDPPDPGEYIYNVQGEGAIKAQSEDKTFTVGSTATNPTADGLAFGPCQTWITGADVVASTSDDLGVDADHAFELDSVAEVASFAMWALSGRIFPGVCEQTVRPCQNGCGHWRGSIAAGDSLGWWWTGWGGLYGPGWYNDAGDYCGCTPLSTVPLAGYPVRRIVEVKVDGNVIDPSTYEVMRRAELVYKADPGPPVVPRFWPACQDLRLPDTEPGTFSVKYTCGIEAPQIGRDAACQVAAELWKASNGGNCKLPAKATRLVRQGITIEKAIPIAEMFKAGATGLIYVDLFLATANPSGATRRPAIYSPDKRRFGIRADR